MKARRPVRPRVELMERRWLPSGLVAHAAAEVSALAAKAKPLALRGTLKGSAALLVVPGGPNGVRVTASGRLSKTPYVLNGAEKLSDIQTPGASFTLFLGATKGGKNAVLDLRVTGSPTGALNYTITGGTKFLKGSTGSGTILLGLPQGPPTGAQPVPITLRFSK